MIIDLKIAVYSFVSVFVFQLLISKLEKKNLSAAEKDLIMKVR